MKDLMADTVWLARMAGKLERLENNEGAAMFQLELMLATGDLQRVLGCAEIVDADIEFQIPGAGRADMVLHHPGGGMTVIEAKAGRDLREAVGGIGQLFMYEAALRRRKINGARPTYIRKVLAVPMLAEESMPAYEAAMLAGIRLLHLAWWGMLKATIAAVKESADV